MSQELLFVFGAARSGTTYLEHLLGRWFDYGMGPEGTFVKPFAKRLRRYGDLRIEANLERLIQDVSECEMLRILRTQFRRDLTPALIRSRVTEPTYAGVVYAVFRSLADHQGRSRVGNKNPRYWAQLDLLEDLFPSRARYLGIVRDGRDVALSNLRTPWGLSSVYAAARDWARSLEAVDRFKPRIGADRLLVIRYEDLLESAAETLDRVAAFVGVGPSWKRDEFLAAARENPKRDNFGKWRAEMSEKDIRIFEAIAGRWLEAYGYARADPTARVRLHERLGCELREWWRLARLNTRSWPTRA